jgi:16S rRNA (uracil1498-N3)-methyltransferase
MNFPFFFCEKIDYSSPLVLDPDTSRHIAQVLRMHPGEKLHLTDGKGHLALAEIIEADKRQCSVNVLNKDLIPPPPGRIIIGISLLKKPARFEWFLEKAAEIGVAEIIPVRCMRTEKQQFRKERAEQILHSAMLQSRQVHKTMIHDLIDFKTLMETTNATVRWIAHCEENQSAIAPKSSHEGDTIILIGPEGDFTKEEIEMAINHGFKSAGLGQTRLRTETAGIVAAVLMKFDQ